MTQNNIQNIFIDIKSYELIQNEISLDELISFLLNNINTSDIHPLSIKGHLFEVEYRALNPNLSFIYTIDGYHIIEPCKNKFRENVYIYNSDSIASYGDDFCGAEFLLYTCKPTLLVLPYKENGLSKMDSSTGEFIQRL